MANEPPQRSLGAETVRFAPEYDRLKRRFHGGSMSEYRDAKAEFVETVLTTVSAGESPTSGQC